MTGPQWFRAGAGAQLIADHWPSQSFYARPPLATFEDLRKGPLARVFADVKSVEQVLPGQPVEVFCKERAIPLRQMAPEQAQRVFDRGGWTVRLRAVQTTYAEARAYRHALAAVVSRRSVLRGFYANVWMSPAHWQGIPHFDGHEVLAIQIFGRKTWRYCPPAVMPNASLGFELGHARPASIHFGVPEHRVPDALPSGATCVTLEPGDVLFLPRGWYHETRGHEAPSMHITFSLETMNWAELMVQAVFRSLQAESRWREIPARLFDGEVSFAGQLEQRVDDLVEALRGRTSAAQAEELARSMFDSWSFAVDTDYIVNPLACVRMRPGDRLVIERQGESTELELPVEWLAVARWLCVTTVPFTLAQAEAAAGGLDREMVEGVLALLAREGVLWSRRSRHDPR